MGFRFSCIVHLEMGELDNRSAQRALRLDVIIHLQETSPQHKPSSGLSR